nr:unnamed protein product [Callosobruchus chinensis]
MSSREGQFDSSVTRP